MRSGSEAELNHYRRGCKAHIIIAFCGSVALGVSFQRCAALTAWVREHSP